VFLAACLAGAVASLSGFGIGSILTPLLALSLGTRLAVAVVSVPHLCGTALRFALLRQHVDKRVLLSFGVTSALGGLAGALLHVRLQSAMLGYILAVLLLFAGLMGVSGWAERFRLSGPAAWIAGAASGIFGGLVGNQGGIRSAALLGFDIPGEAFVATATAIGLMVDALRMPVYAATQFGQIASAWRIMTVATAGVVSGTLLARPLLRRIPERPYKRTVAALILALGVWMLFHPGA
jgi:uncharacterized membrane protein YfcA